MQQRLTARLSNVIPFFPFSDDEAAVIAHKFVLRLCDSYREPIATTSIDYLGKIHLNLHEDGEACSILGKSYTIDEGAHSLEWAVEDKIGKAVSKAYWSFEEPVEEVKEGLLLEMVAAVRLNEERVAEVNIHVEREITSPRSFA